MKRCINKFEDADFKYDISFLEFEPNVQLKQISSQIKGFLFLFLETFVGADVKYHNAVVFRIPVQKYPNKTNLVLNLKKKKKIVTNITFSEIEGGGVKDNNSFFKF